MNVHGVYSKDGLLSMHGREFKRYQHVSIQSIQGLFNLALTHGLTHLWITKDSGIVPDKRFYQYDEKFYDLTRANWTKTGEQLKTVTGWRLPAGGQQQITVIFTGNTRWATSGKPGVPGWAARCTPQHLLITIHYLEKALGTSVAGSPSKVGWDLVKRFHPEWLKAQKFANMKIFPFGPKAAKDLIWQQKPMPLTCRYLHKFDKNSAYLAAAASEFYGAGDILMSSSFDGKSCGVWDCVVTKTMTSDLPPILEDKGTWSQWLAGPMIRLLRAKGYEVEIKQGYAFKERHQIFGKWAEFVFNKRWAFIREDEWKHPQCRLYAAEAMKQIAVATIGLTGYKGYGEDEETDKGRPDIKMQTVARSYELMYHNMVKTLELDEKLPDMIYMDAFYYESDERDGRLSFPSLMKREGKLGGFKYEGAIEITDEVRAILSAKKAVNEKLEQLNKIGWEK